MLNIKYVLARNMLGIRAGQDKGVLAGKRLKSYCYNSAKVFYLKR